MAVVTALILVLAANTAFNGFPVLGSVLAQDRYLPRQLHTRGDRLAFSNGIVFLAGAAIVFVVGLRRRGDQAHPALHRRRVRLVQSRPDGMVRHWTRLLATETDPASPGRMQRSRSINIIGLVMTAAVLIIVLITKFLAGRLDRDRGDGGDLRS